VPSAALLAGLTYAALGEESMTSANLLIVIIVGAVVGALTGLALGGTLHGFYLAVVAGLLGTLVAGVARNEIMKRSGAGPDDSKIPNLVLVYSAIASLGGSALADEIVRIGGLDSAVWLGTLAGLFSCILLAMLMITYYMNPETGRHWKKN
jgi:uncharacterized membrane protein YeaQ/YmgE (transglycosylase-associated protein family)